MNQLKLVKPQLELENEYLSFYNDWKESGEDMVPWVIEKDPNHFEDMLTFLSDHENGVNIPAGWVSDSTLWLINEHNRVLGAVNIRHRLTPFLLESAGHIGYGIRPSDRRKGYATKLLELALIEAKKLGIDQVLVVCDADNIGSEKTIIKNGGKYYKDFVEENGNIVKRFWISQ